MIHDVRRPTLDDRLRCRKRPAGRPAMHHAWRNLLFLHWRVEPERVQRTLPPGLFVDVHDGAAYVGVVPFFMRDIRPRGLPAVPGLSNFLELNVRTYVHDAEGRPGVWFYSLDCNSRLTVWGARKFFHLPYRQSRMNAVTGDDGATTYRSQVEKYTTQFTYRFNGEAKPSEPGTLEFFLVERYLLFSAARDGRLFTGQVVHEPYPLVDVALRDWSSNLFTRHDWNVDESRPDHVCASPGVEVDVYWLDACANRSQATVVPH